MGKQASILDALIEFVVRQDSNPFEDFYIFLVLRFLIYIYLFLKLSDILLGYERPNLKTRVLRKFQYVYGNQILKQLDRDDMQELQLTINNTILNATKELKPNSLSRKINIDKNNLSESERRSLKHQETVESLGSLPSIKTLQLKFDFSKNQYYDPPSVRNLMESRILKEQLHKKPEPEQVYDYIQEVEVEVEGQSEEEQLSPTLPRNRLTKPITLLYESPHSHQDRQTQKSELQQANIHYPEKELSGMDLEIQQKFVQTQENLLHLSPQKLHNSLIGNQHSQYHEKQFQNFPSIIKETNAPQNQNEEFDT